MAPQNLVNLLIMQSWRLPSPRPPRLLVLCSPLSPQPLPIFQPFPDFAFKAAFGRIVEAPSAEPLGDLVLAGESVGRVVIVVLARSAAVRFHQACARAEH